MAIAMPTKLLALWIVLVLPSSSKQTSEKKVWKGVNDSLSNQKVFMPDRSFGKDNWLSWTKEMRQMTSKASITYLILWHEKIIGEAGESGKTDLCWVQILKLFKVNY